MAFTHAPYEPYKDCAQRAGSAMKSWGQGNGKCSGPSIRKNNEELRQLAMSSMTYQQKLDVYMARQLWEK